MIALICFCLTLFALPFKSKIRLEAENASLRHQVIVLQRRVRARVQLTNGDRLFLVMLYRWFHNISAHPRGALRNPVPERASDSVDRTLAGSLSPQPKLLSPSG